MSIFALFPNPAPSHDYLVTLACTVGETTLTLQYAPDKEMAAGESFQGYTASRINEGLPPEVLALSVLEAVNNYMLPRWIQVSVDVESNGRRHRALVEDKQPNWQNPHFLARLNRL